MNKEKLEKFAEILATLPPLHAMTAAKLYQDNPELYDWEYKSVPWCTVAAWEELLGIIGKGNFKLVAGSQRKTNGVEARRGQFIISPVGMENLREEYKRRKL